MSMKRFLAFTGDCYYPDKGMRDFFGDFDSEEEAISEVKKHVGAKYSHDPKWAVVYDSEAREEVWDI
jgi:hypothetical protein